MVLPKKRESMLLPILSPDSKMSGLFFAPTLPVTIFNPMKASEDRYYFKYEFGYINIDKKNVYLTNSGNWSETLGMEEKSKETIRKSDNRKTWIIVYLLIGCMLISLFHFAHILNSGMGYLLIFTIPLGCLPLYKYMRNEIGPKFKIPIEKIISIQDESNGLRINFKDTAFQEDSVFISYPRGLTKELLEELIS